MNYCSESKSSDVKLEMASETFESYKNDLNFLQTDKVKNKDVKLNKIG